MALAIVSFERMLQSIDCDKADASFASDLGPSSSEDHGFLRRVQPPYIAVREKLRKLFMAATMAQLHLLSAELVAANELKASLNRADSTTSSPPGSRRASSSIHAARLSELAVVLLTALLSPPPAGCRRRSHLATPAAGRTRPTWTCRFRLGSEVRATTQPDQPTTQIPSRPVRRSEKERLEHAQDADEHLHATSCPARRVKPTHLHRRDTIVFLLGANTHVVTGPGF